MITYITPMWIAKQRVNLLRNAAAVDDDDRRRLRWMKWMKT
jgi:hypothetical protein